MFKQSLLILLAASIISIGAFAQDAPPNNQPSAQENGGGHHGTMDPAQRTHELTQKLNLTADQQSKVQQVLQSESSQMESVRSDNSLSQQDRHTKMMAIHQTETRRSGPCSIRISRSSGMRCRPSAGNGAIATERRVQATSKLRLLNNNDPERKQPGSRRDGRASAVRPGSCARSQQSWVGWCFRRNSLLAFSHADPPRVPRNLCQNLQTQLQCLATILQ